MKYIVECVKTSLKYIMKSVLYLSIVVYFYPVGAFPRSLPLHSVIPKGLEIERKLNFDSKGTGKVSWAGFESSRLDVRQNDHNQDRSSTDSKNFNRKSLETKFMQNSNSERFIGDNRVDESHESSTEVQITSTDVEESVDAHNNGTVVNLDIKESTVDVTSENFSDSVILSILNLTEDVKTLQASSENSDTTEFFTFGKTTLNESKITSLPDVTTDFDLFIDAETKKNNILEELLSSQSNLIKDDKTFSTVFSHTEDSTPGIDSLKLGTNAESELQEIIISGSPNSTRNEVDTDEMKTKNELNENDSKDVGTEIVIPQTEVPVCPEPGWCIFWFLAQDTCAKDSHCLGSRICCLWGCSKTCTDID